MTKPEDIPQWAWDKAQKTAKLASAPYNTPEMANHLIARVILSAVEEDREAIASYVEGKGGVLPGTNVFAYVVSRNNQPCMSGDARDRLNKFDRRAFDAASASLASAIRNRKES